MDKIMFNTRYGLEQAVINGTKTMTRRIVPAKYLHLINEGSEELALAEAQKHGDAFKVGQIVAIAQAYKVVNQSVNLSEEYTSSHPGWNNKMFVRADLMPHQIEVTSARVEKLQDITDEDCLKEGIGLIATPLYMDVPPFTEKSYSFIGSNYVYKSPREAFAALIDKVSPKGTWNKNPYVFAYGMIYLKNNNLNN